MDWFARNYEHSLDMAHIKIDRTIAKARFWLKHADQNFSAEQKKALNKLLDGNFPDGPRASKYAAFAQVSKATATRHLSDLHARGIVEKTEGQGPATRYRIPDDGPDQKQNVSLSLGRVDRQLHGLLLGQLNRAQREIEEDVRNGRLPLIEIRSFSELHDFVDANEYLHAGDSENGPLQRYFDERGIPVKERMEISKRLAAAIDGWIKNGRQGDIVDHLDQAASRDFSVMIAGKAQVVVDLYDASKIFLDEISKKKSGVNETALIKRHDGTVLGHVVPDGTIFQGEPPIDAGSRILFRPGKPDPYRVEDMPSELAVARREVARFPASYLKQWRESTIEALTALADEPARGSRTIKAGRELKAGLQVIELELKKRGLVIAKEQNRPAASLKKVQGPKTGR